jgi:hypothetical protein
MRIKKRFIVDEKNHPVAVVLDLPTFRQIEELLEDNGLARYMTASLEHEKPLPLTEARKRYRKLKKRP